jgi:hypothetical protein
MALVYFNMAMVQGKIMFVAYDSFVDPVYKRQDFHIHLREGKVKQSPLHAMEALGG